MLGAYRKCQRVGREGVVGDPQDVEKPRLRAGRERTLRDRRGERKPPRAQATIFGQLLG